VGGLDLDEEIRAVFIETDIRIALVVKVERFAAGGAGESKFGEASGEFENVVVIFHVQSPLM
jgi:hypothetical protein